LPDTSPGTQFKNEQTTVPVEEARYRQFIDQQAEVTSSFSMAPLIFLPTFYRVIFLLLSFLIVSLSETVVPGAVTLGASVEKLPIYDH
jgi:uncharacterized membrane protein